ncbi:MAG: DUF2264 domain-containing protein [Candidatus Azobacteroides sp.]|nr:DUF2264 domain-containing protein [Candidatus Azobacteroides sp.]
MKKNKFLLVIISVLLSSVSYGSDGRSGEEGHGDRAYWIDLCHRITLPILKNMGEGKLKVNMPVELSPEWDNRNKNVVYMEAFGRLMAGIAPWFNLPDDDTDEGKLRKEFRQMALQSYKNAVDPLNPDYLLWQGANQALVDAAYIANSFLRAPESLWGALDKDTKDRYIKEFRSLRKIRPPYNNWLLFRSMIEAFFVFIGEEYDGYVLELALRKTNEWYLGDGWYSDGPEYALDYYNGYVMHPMVVEIVEVMENNNIPVPITLDLAIRRMQRYNQLLERLISPEATFPPVGRSMTYRMGAFQPLALAAWKYGCPDKLTYGQIRNALTSIMKKMFSIEGNMDQEGFLRLGFVGYQPELADYYTNNGSLYITSLVFLPLGLPPEHEFWTAPPEEWTSRKAWSGKPFPKDYHESVKN